MVTGNLWTRLYMLFSAFRRTANKVNENRRTDIPTSISQESRDILKACTVTSQRLELIVSVQEENQSRVIRARVSYVLFFDELIYTYFCRLAWLNHAVFSLPLAFCDGSSILWHFVRTFLCSWLFRFLFQKWE